MKKSVSDVAIIGGGAIGLACAWRLVQSGARVHLFERNGIGQEASLAAAGMLAAQCEAAVHPPAHQTVSANGAPTRSAFFELCLQSRALYPEFAEQLLEATGQDIELSMQGAPTSDWRAPGILYVSNGRDADTLEHFAAQCQQGLQVEETHFNNHPARLLPQEGQVANRKLLAALRAACELAGVAFHENTPVTLEEAQQQAGKVLLCGGAWSSHIAPELAPGIYPVAGEVLYAWPDEKIDRVLYSRDVYMVPRRNGWVLIGATMNLRGFDKSTSTQARDFLLEAASRLVPTARHWKIEEQWAGLRPASADELPLLGKTARENVYVATGHFRNGILLTPVTAKLVTQALLNDAEIPTEFSPLRFQREC